MAKFDLSNEFDVQSLRTKVEYLIEHKAVCELTEKSIKRTLQQNAYLHVILGIVGMEFGEDIEYVKKQYFKYLVNPTIFVRQRYDKILNRDVVYLRSSRDVTIEEMSQAISKWIEWARREHGIFIPSSDDYIAIARAQVAIDKAYRYM